ncbi:septum site-determining protein MinC [Tepidibacillus fermentans]|uniref:Probable septum site-determining protein MinC n=1 Tax=Tepidibacillus fermentans TaxID=1281767 RepID=A0A4R3K7W6_9BACI|nr:septum site-determining protein MinC [Tepidibacillus fermentans]TCS79064.1 septum site-determining protein MinC [Tepidibacillus fermentans]
MTNKQNVLIKGTKDGLMFLLSDDCSFDELIRELREKLEHSHQHFLTGPIMKVTIKTGNRKLTLYQEERIREIFKIKGNLLIQAIEDELRDHNWSANHVKVVSGTIRSGQVYQFSESILFIGDVNPGGNLFSTGDIYVLGALRGVAHAGINGNMDSIIAASIMEPTQLRIGHLVSHPQEKWKGDRNKQEFAYVKGDQIELDQIQHLSKRENLLASFQIGG